MKKIHSFFILTLVALANISIANGYHEEGYVKVGPNYMAGTMSVRYSVGEGTPFISANTSSNGSVVFAALDSQGKYLLCYVPSNSLMYYWALESARHFTNGSYLSVQKNDNNSECSYIMLTNASYYLD
jgi:hypothetical protein